MSTWLASETPQAHSERIPREVGIQPLSATKRGAELAYSDSSMETFPRGGSIPFLVRNRSMLTNTILNASWVSRPRLGPFTLSLAVTLVLTGVEHFGSLTGLLSAKKSLR